MQKEEQNLKISDNYPQYHNIVGDLYVKTNFLSEAEREYKLVLEQQDFLDYPDEILNVRYKLAELYSSRGDLDLEEMTYLESVHRDGRIWGFSILALILAFPLLLCIIFNAVPEWEAMGRALLAVLPMYWAVGIIEIFTYVPMLGAGGSYLSFVTGNISNLKLPCALDAMEKADVKADSDEGEVISTIAIATSSIVTILIILIGVILIVPLLTLMDNFPQLQYAFDNVLPALFGGLGVVYLSRYFKIAVLPMSIMLLLFVFVPYLNAGMVGIMIPVSMIITIVYSRILYNKERKANGELE